MVGLIDEIQREAVNDSVPVSSLLRKVKLAAAKLQLPEIEDWVNGELNGYTGEVPVYRRLHGIPKAFNPYNGWIPIMVSAEQHAMISRAYTGQSIASIEHVLSSSSEKMLTMPLRPALIAALNSGSDVQFGEMANFVGRSELAAVLDIVRTKILDWAIALEKEGIRGENMSFSPDEKKAAHKSSTIHIGSVGVMTGVIGDQNTVGNIVGGNLNMQEIANLAHQLQSNMPALVNTGADGPLLQKATNGLLEEVGKQAPNQGAIKGFLVDARNALSGAAGNLLASGAVAMITDLLPSVAG